ncbi:hypothetical protein VOLCADRAFT_107250 [Volvox carteri f. nagariensis]|uniref:Transmembrane protein n=1 Tax=Volvox carteri f. nagariensis TaxID=3068 RepID=D8UCU8_VOLCA|nr:uncharacterized protein VOLCADRAFT_107250 [Volvox carteri f. nagariensis]EFJ42404.1 hypothetical protein VOLCADRAFT_107250 [Volvox carteri f. nagariensis]|eukprot:XP_002956467.1 hypothetical protein VOLCADRAFT_107250 [Volvox carteri f. nagariensis]
MDDVVLYTAYYSSYHVRAAEAAALPSISRKGQGLVCAFLAFGATCGISTVAVGFLAHNPAVIWPVVALGLVGVVVGLILAHWKATDCGMWGFPPSTHRSASDSQQEGALTSGEATLPGGSSCQGVRYYLPMYCADALDVEMGIVQQSYFAQQQHPLALPGKAKVADEAKCCGGGTDPEDGSAAAAQGEAPESAAPLPPPLLPPLPPLQDLEQEHPGKRLEVQYVRMSVRTEGLTSVPLVFAKSLFDGKYLT